jgi:hypothetical protein
MARRPPALCWAGAELMASTLGERVVREWRMKVTLFLVMPVVFWLVYLGIQRHPIFPTRTLPCTWVDAAVPFSGAWIYPYESLWLLFQVLWLVPSSGQLWQYTRGFAVVCGVSFAVFVMLPTAAPRPIVHATGLYALLVGFDSPLNAFPSLHVGLTAYTVFFAYRPLGVSATAVAVLTLWAGLIVWSTLGLKQHWVVDLPPALVLAWAAHRYACWQPAGGKR